MIIYHEEHERHEDCFKAFRQTEGLAKIQRSAAMLASHPFDRFDKLTAGRLRAWLVGGTSI